MQTLRRPCGRQPAASVLSSDSSTVVDTGDILKRYEHLLSQLSQQAMEQQAEIQALRAALQAQECVASTPPRSKCAEAGIPMERQRRHRRKAKHAARHLPSRYHDHLTYRRHHTVHKKVDPSSLETFREHAPFTSLPVTVSHPTSPQISSIALNDEAEVLSLNSHELVNSEAEASKQAHDVRFLSTRYTNNVEPLVCVTPTRVLYGKDSAKDVSSFDVSGNSDGLSPSPPRAAKQTTITDDGLGMTSSVLSQATKQSECVESPSRNTAERVSDGRMQKQQHHHHPHETTPEVIIHGQNPMDYLLTVFSSMSKEDVQSDKLRVASSGVVRQLFNEAKEDKVGLPAEEMQNKNEGMRTSGLQVTRLCYAVPAHAENVVKAKEAHRIKAVASHTLPQSPPSPSPFSSWQQRYARNVATAKSESTQHSEPFSDAAQTSRCGASFSPNQSASELVEELIQFFTS